MTPDRKIHVNCYLTKDQLLKLQAASKKSRVPQSVMIREAVKDYLLQYEKTGRIILNREEE